MSGVSPTVVDRSVQRARQNDAAEIYGLPAEPPSRQVVRVELLPEEAEVSLPQRALATSQPFAALTRFFGPRLTFASPAWGGDPVPRMRALQKKLVEFSLGVDEDDRSECMAAISMVETAVRLRLRYQQMRMTELEMQIKNERGTAEARRS